MTKLFRNVPVLDSGARGATTTPATITLAVVATVILLRTEWNQSLLVLAAGVVGAVALR